MINLTIISQPIYFIFYEIIVSVLGNYESLFTD